jgi:hypothetical protein
MVPCGDGDMAPLVRTSLTPVGSEADRVGPQVCDNVRND